MAFPVIPIAGGIAFAKWGPAILKRVKGLFIKEPSLDLDVGLPIAQQRDMQNLLQNVSNPLVLQGAIAWYQAQGYPISAQALRLKLAAIISKG